MKKLLILVAALATLASPVSAQAAASVEQVPFEADVLACNGDVIHLSGRLLVVFTETATLLAVSCSRLISNPKA
jgi:hypothetical protein